jgi:hypothetical protein
LIAISRGELYAQSSAHPSFGDPTVADKDLTINEVPADVSFSVVQRSRENEFNDNDRAIFTAIIAAPPRVLLSAADAIEHACRVMGRLVTPPAEDGTARSDSRAGDDARVTLIMGLDYKKDRRGQSRERGDAAAVRVFSAIHLAEWVMVVEGEVVSDDSAAGELSFRWEVVYDASSGGAQPRIQLVRIGGQVVVEYPGRSRGPERATLRSGDFRGVKVPLRTAKSAASDTAGAEDE